LIQGGSQSNVIADSENPNADKCSTDLEDDNPLAVEDNPDMPVGDNVQADAEDVKLAKKMLEAGDPGGAAQIVLSLKESLQTVIVGSDVEAASCSEDSWTVMAV